MSDSDGDYNSGEDSGSPEERGTKRRAASPPPRASERPKRAAAARARVVLAAERSDEEEEEEDEDEFPVIPKATLTKYKNQLAAPAGTILVIRKQTLDPAMLSALKVQSWPTWENTTGGWPDLNTEYEYEHTKRELSYFLEGTAVVTPEGGEPITINAGDYAVFPKKLACTWVIQAPVKKHYYEFAR